MNLQTVFTENWMFLLPPLNLSRMIRLFEKLKYLGIYEFRGKKVSYKPLSQEEKLIVQIHQQIQQIQSMP